MKHAQHQLKGWHSKNAKDRRRCKAKRNRIPLPEKVLVWLVVFGVFGSSLVTFGSFILHPRRPFRLLVAETPPTPIQQNARFWLILGSFWSFAFGQCHLFCIAFCNCLLNKYLPVSKFVAGWIQPNLLCGAQHCGCGCGCDLKTWEYKLYPYWK